MLSSRTKLEICQKLSHGGFRPEFYPGARVARGFADLGFEEFSFLPGQKIVSLLTGEQSAILPEHADHFFLVPSLDETLNFIHKVGIDIDSLVYQDQRQWDLRCRNIKTGECKAISDVSLEIAILKILLLGAFQ